MEKERSFILKFIHFIRLKGDSVINGTCKLSLTTDSLAIMNTYFKQVLSSENLIPDNKRLSSLIDDLQYLRCFFAKITSLKLHHSSRTFQTAVDLSYFTSLKILELSKVPINLIIGIEKISFQLETFICNHSVHSLKDLLHVGFETNSKYSWIKLKELNIAFNNIKDFDISVIPLANLTYLDASHNNLKYVDEVQGFDKLVYLNLSFNLLEYIPILNSLSCSSLKVLYIRNNALDNLDGIDVFNNLEELDVSYNCLSTHSTLKFLKKLSALKTLQIKGNPIFFHKKHRLLTSKYLHPAVITREFLLDGKELSLIEIKNISHRKQGLYSDQIRNFHQTSINVMVEDSNILHCHEVKVTHVPCRSSSLNNSYMGENQLESLNSNDSLEKQLKHKNRSFVAPGKVGKEKLIAENDKNLENNETKDQNFIPTHLQAKLHMEERRKKFKDSWLIPEQSHEFTKTSKLMSENQENVATDSTSLTQRFECQADENTTDKKDITQETESMDKNKAEKYSSVNSLIEEVDWGISSADKSYFNCYDDSEAKVLIVTKIEKNKETDIFIQIENNLLKEMDSVSAKITECLDLTSLISLDVTEKNKQYLLHLNFDSTNSGRQNRQYSMDDKAVFNELLSACKLFVTENADINVFQCLKCSMTFSKQEIFHKVRKTKIPSTDITLKNSNYRKDFPKEVKVCPNCGGSVIIDIQAHANTKTIENLNDMLSMLPVHHDESSWNPNAAENLSDMERLATSLPQSSSYLHNHLSPFVKENHSLSDNNSMTFNKTEKINRDSSFNSEKFKRSCDPQDSVLHFNNNSTKFSKNQNSNSEEEYKHVKLINLLDEKEIYSSEAFTITIDPRIKLHLEFKVFDNTENLEAYLEAGVVAFPNCEEFKGALAISNKRIRIMKIFDNADDSFEENVKQFDVLFLSDIKEITILLGNQGFTITSVNKAKTFLFFLQDADICNTFCSYLIEIFRKVSNFQPIMSLRTEEFLSQISTEIISFYFPSVDNSDLLHKIELHLFATLDIPGEINCSPVCIVMTHENIFLSTIQYERNAKSSKNYQFFHYIPFRKEKIQDLIEIVLGEELLWAKFRFHNEEEETASTWIISTRTKSSLLSLLQAFKNPWEEIFQIELPIYFTKNEK